MGWLLERRLTSVTRRLKAAREDLAVTEEQLIQVRDEADDAALRAITSDDQSAPLDSNDAARHRDALLRHRADLLDAIAKLETRQDELLDEFNQRSGGTP
ncbi:MAG: hypothetical protein GX868_15285 [Actinobacteria bacterium]|nr:hypothetical protein [Actinomycetota bacterium]